MSERDSALLLTAQAAEVIMRTQRAGLSFTLKKTVRGRFDNPIFGAKYYK
jgi:hypothetical protein